MKWRRARTALVVHLYAQPESRHGLCYQGFHPKGDEQAGDRRCQKCLAALERRVKLGLVHPADAYLVEVTRAEP